MKKFLLSAMSLLAMTTAWAGVEGTYVVNKYAGVDTGNDYKFSSGETWSSDDPVEEGEEDEPWIVNVALTSEGLTMENLMGWGESVPCTFDEATGILTIAGGTLVDDSDYCSYICGGLEGYTSASSVMGYCDDNNGWIYNSLGLLDFKFKLEGDNLILTTPILEYTDYYPGFGYHGIAISCFTQFELEPYAEAGEIVGAWLAETYAGATTGSNYKFSSGETWSSDDPVEDGEEDEDWIITVEETADGYTISNLIAWEETVPCTFDKSTGILTIAGGTLVDDSDYCSYICGGLEDYTTASSVMAYCDDNNGWIYDSRGLLDIKLQLDGDNLTLLTPILVYTDYYPGMGYHGIAISCFSKLELVRDSGSGIAAPAVVDNSNAPVEYYSLQGVRIATPAAGQVVIMRQGDKATKVLVR